MNGTPTPVASSNRENVLAHVLEKFGVTASPVQVMAEEGLRPSCQLRISAPTPFLGGCAWEGWIGAGRLLTSQLQVPGRKGVSLSMVAAEVPGETLVDWVTCRACGSSREIRLLLRLWKGQVGKVGRALVCHLPRWGEGGVGQMWDGGSFCLSRGVVPNQRLGRRRWAVGLGRGMKVLGCRRTPYSAPGCQHHKPSLGMGVLPPSPPWHGWPQLLSRKPPEAE